MSLPVGLLYDPVFLEHGDPHHPESRRRLEAIVAQLQDPGAGALWDRCVEPDFEPATADQLAWVHDPEYIAEVEDIARAGGGYLDPDTCATPRTYEAAALAAGAAISATQAVLLGELEQAFCFVRPPGHHARPGAGKGFCFFNNVAVAAECALRQGHRDRVAIVDWDLHHGNGTQESFYSRREVLYTSLHQSPYYPFSGGVDEIGSGDGLGATINIPLPMGSGDEVYERAFDGLVLPALDAFRPELILVSAGYDAHFADPLGQMLLTTRAYFRLTRQLLAGAVRHCQARLVLVLEGGYDTQALARGVAATLAALLGDAEPEPETIPYEVHPEILTRTTRHLEALLQVHQRTLRLVPQPTM
jgi:acetoin utilization deacetylase AcuC-like enzyme